MRSIGGLALILALSIPWVVVGSLREGLGSNVRFERWWLRQRAWVAHFRREWRR